MSNDLLDLTSGDPEVPETKEAPKPAKRARAKQNPDPVVDEIITEEGVTFVEEAKKTAPKVVAPKKERKAVIFIDNERGQPNFKFVGVNGYGYRIKRGERVTVPASVVSVLENAIATRPVKQADGSVFMEEYYTTPFRVLSWIEE